MAGNLRKLVKGSGSLLLITLLLTGSRCNDEKDPEFVFMTFEIPLTIRPGNETLNKGDTIWLDGNFSDTLKEINSNLYYKLENFDFKSKICINKIFNNQLYVSEQMPAFSLFNYLGGTTQTSSVCGTFSINYVNKTYTYKIGFIPNDTGVFNIFINRPFNLSDTPESQIDLRPYIKLDDSDDGRKRIPVYEAFQFIINNGNTNFELFKQNAKVGNDIVPSEQLGSFTFRVVE
jgi:hypothetical protein